MKQLYSHLLIVLLCCMLTACGFQLRGKNEIPPAARVIYLQSNNPYGEFAGTLRSALPPLGIKLIDSPQAAPITLDILSSILNYYPVSIGTSNDATVYNVAYQVTLTIKNAKGKVLIPTRMLKSTSSLMVNVNSVLGSNNQLELLSKQLQRDIVIQLVNLLSSPQLQQGLQKS